MAGWSIHFWEPTLSPHKLSLFRALGAQPAVAACTYISQQALSPERRAQGWTLENLDSLDIRIAPDTADIDATVAAAAKPEHVHIFSGIHGPPVVAAGIAAAIRHGARFGIMSEPRVDEGVVGFLRTVHSQVTERRLRARADFVLAIGRNGPPWFRRVGYDPRRIFPFGYFLPAPLNAGSLVPAGGKVRLAYLGRLTEAKGIGLLLDALPMLPPEVEVVVAGHGPARPLVEAAAANGRLQFAGILPMETVPAFLASVDVLVQPSLTTNDGWGAVISEALLAGAAAVATAKTGASILLDDPTRGQVMARPDAHALAEAVTTLIAGKVLSFEHRAARAQWARSRLTGEAGAAHLLAVLAHRFEDAPPVSPFYL